jgi:DNA-directed RNA polymerase subunit beta'
MSRYRNIELETEQTEDAQDYQADGTYIDEDEMV